MFAENCEHFPDGFYGNSCASCSGKTAEYRESMRTTPEADKEILAKRIADGEGYWSNERLRALSGPRLVRCHGCGEGSHPGEARQCGRCQRLNRAVNAEIISDWHDSLGEMEMSKRERETLQFMAEVAADWSARKTHTAFTGLYPDDPPLRKAVRSA